MAGALAGEDNNAIPTVCRDRVAAGTAFHAASHEFIAPRVGRQSRSHFALTSP
jgi:hypothetical protein